ncbi:hypothetical protein I7I51_03250 [Histoplasma capsulatum]|uniref:Uncharacterized protein n=1 Tax=Ajellomyces capsulatus TaxID=5037 RepID=A0A8A1M3P8_AJECA|nr:hypothetical protein I7I51_03250 [Histoplasma capsulatum]
MFNSGGYTGIRIGSISSGGNLISQGQMFKYQERKQTLFTVKFSLIHKIIIIIIILPLYSQELVIQEEC